MTIVRVTRADYGFGVARKLDIYIDGEKAGTVGWAKTAELRLPAGEHQMQVKMGNLESPLMMLNCQGQDIELATGAKARIAAAILPSMLLASQDFFVIREIHLKPK